jgi:2-aminoadipate transaminase
VRWSKPHGGLFIWLQLPSGLSARDLLSFAEKEGVTFSPGDLFFLGADRKEFMRLCFIQTDEQTIQEGVKRLAAAYKNYAHTAAQAGASVFSAARSRDQVLI